MAQGHAHSAASRNKRKLVIVFGLNLIIAIARGAKIPGVAAISGAGVVGLVGYGISLTLFVLALRHIGTARTGAYFSAAPFVGAVISILVLGDAVTLYFLAATALMAIGIWLHPWWADPVAGLGALVVVTAADCRGGRIKLSFRLLPPERDTSPEGDAEKEIL